MEDSTAKLINLSTRIPMHFSLADSIYLMKDREELKGRLSLQGIELKRYYPYLFTLDGDIGGLLASEFTLSNSLNDPRVDGRLSLRDGSLKLNGQGIYYHDINIKAQLDTQKISLSSFSMQAGQGVMDIDGYLEIDTNFVPGYIHLNIKGEGFTAVRSPWAEAIIRPDIILDGPVKNMKLDGHVTLEKGYMDADYFMAQIKVKTDDPNPPLLVEAVKDTARLPAGPVRGNKKGQAGVVDQLLQNTRGTFDVKIPGNTWIRGNDMNVEIKGDIKAVVQGEQIELFGDLDVNRGYYEYYGKRLDINKGTITFTGGSKVNPRLNVRIGYRFRDTERLLRTLNISISGTLEQPDFAFSLDDKRIDEKTAIAYLLFEKPPGMLTEQESSAVSKNTSAIARNIGYNQLSSVLKESLQTSLDLDVVEISGSETWNAAQLKVGKYVTKNLYLSYEQDFAFDKESNVLDTETINLEYQVLRSLFIRATNQESRSGFDLIFKYSWE